MKEAETWSVNYTPTTEADNLIFAYKYDKRQRVIETKIPGKSVVYTLYNNSNWPILKQDGNQRIRNEWSFIKYDAYGRTIMTGVCIDSYTPLMQKDIDANALFEERDATSTTGYTSKSYPVAGGTVNTINYYDDYDYDIDNKSTTKHSYITSDIVPNPKLSRSNINRMTGTKTKILDNTTAWKISLFFSISMAE